MVVRGKPRPRVWRITIMPTAIYRFTDTWFVPADPGTVYDFLSCPREYWNHAWAMRRGERHLRELARPRQPQSELQEAGAQAVAPVR